MKYLPRRENEQMPGRRSVFGWVVLPPMHLQLDGHDKAGWWIMLALHGPWPDPEAWHDELLGVSVTCRGGGARCVRACVGRHHAGRAGNIVADYSTYSTDRASAIPSVQRMAVLCLYLYY
jgi:hypothetical protein